MDPVSAARVLAIVVLASSSVLGCEATTVEELGAPPVRAAPEGETPVSSDRGSLGYPIVLSHGFFGFEELAGLDFATYFHEVIPALAASGETRAFTPAVDPFNDSTSRGLELLAHVERILEETGSDKVNIIAHSQGGLDARVVAGLRPDLVASVTTIGTPHGGAPVSSVLFGATPDPNGASGALVDWIARTLGGPVFDEVGEETSIARAFRQFSPEGIREFNAAHPDAEGVAYFSVAGRTDLHSGGEACQVEDAPAFIRAFEAELDPVDPLLALPESITDGALGPGEANDGLVKVGDAVWGRFLGCVPADHFDQIGQVLGDHPGAGNRWTHVDFYVGLARFLRTQGL